MHVYRGKGGKGPREATGRQASPEDPTAASLPAAAGHLGRPHGQGQTAWLSCQLPWRATPQSCPCETCHLQAGAPGQAGWGQGAGSGLRLDQDHCPAGLGSGQTPHLSPQRLGPPPPGERKRVQPPLLPQAVPQCSTRPAASPWGRAPRLNHTTPSLRSPSRPPARADHSPPASTPRPTPRHDTGALPAAGGPSLWPSQQGPHAAVLGPQPPCTQALSSATSLTVLLSRAVRRGSPGPCS